jgi:prevent-host-death family protein
VKVNIHAAKTHLSRLVEQVLAGEEVIIAKAGVPVVKLTRLEIEKPILGGAKGAIKFSEGWDAPLTDEEMISLFDSAE